MGFEGQGSDGPHYHEEKRCVQRLGVHTWGNGTCLGTPGASPKPGRLGSSNFLPFGTQNSTSVAWICR